VEDVLSEAAAVATATTARNRVTWLATAPRSDKADTEVAAAAAAADTAVAAAATAVAAVATEAAAVVAAARSATDAKATVIWLAIVPNDCTERSTIVERGFLSRSHSGFFLLRLELKEPTY